MATEGLENFSPGRAACQRTGVPRELSWKTQVRLHKRGWHLHCAGRSMKPKVSVALANAELCGLCLGPRLRQVPAKPACGWIKLTGDRTDELCSLREPPAIRRAAAVRDSERPGPCIDDVRDGRDECTTHRRSRSPRLCGHDAPMKRGTVSSEASRGGGTNPRRSARSRINPVRRNQRTGVFDVRYCARSLSSAGSLRVSASHRCSRRRRGHNSFIFAL